MAKQVYLGEDIHIAPHITGKRDESGELVIIDDPTDERLYPNHCIEHKIRIFERQVNGWFLTPAFKLLEEDNGFVILMIATAYIEGIEQFRQGKSSKGQSEAFFKKGARRIFGIDSCSQSRVSDLYRELRCNLFHNGMTGPTIRILSTYDKAVDFSDRRIIKINQRLFLGKVRDDFEQYLRDLRDPAKVELRTHFNTMYGFGENGTSRP